jgi:Uma2 family endonuclease
MPLMSAEPETLPEGLRALPPTAEELPYDDGEPMETYVHELQKDLLIETLDLHLRKAGVEAVVAGNMFFYYSLHQVKKNDFRGPDFFCVLGAKREPPRLSWVVWAEGGRLPQLIIELLSRTTMKKDRGEKKDLYERVLRVQDYVLSDPLTCETEAWHLVRGRYARVKPGPAGRLPVSSLGLLLGTWEGSYRGYSQTWLRWFTVEGDVLPTDAELAERRADDEKRRADDEKRRADDEKRRADELERRLAAREAKGARGRKGKGG